MARQSSGREARTTGDGCADGRTESPRAASANVRQELDTSTNLLLPGVMATEERVQDGSGVEALAERW